MTEKPDWLPTRNELLKVYQKCPGMLAEDLDFIFGELKPEQREVHNHIVKKIEHLRPDRNKMLLAVARSIISSVGEQ